jgi:hypothetical protein
LLNQGVIDPVTLPLTSTAVQNAMKEYGIGDIPVLMTIKYLKTVQTGFTF